MTATQMTTMSGGCLCGVLRFAARGEILDAGWCHCRLCQRHGGTPACAYCAVAADAFAITRGRPLAYRSSARAERLSCPTCGSALALRDLAGSFVSFNIAALDEPAAVRPRRHIWTASRVAWFDPLDGLPRFRDGGDTPEPPGEPGR
jgi:hypothetical protein